MRVLWTHNFDPAVLGKGSFVHLAAGGIRERGIDLHLEYLGNLRSPLQIVRARKRVRRLAQEFDLVHAQFGSACAFVTAAVEGIPKVLTLRGSDWTTHDVSLGYLYVHTRLAAGLTHLALDSYACIAAVSQRLATEVVRAAPKAVVAVLPSPVNLSMFVPRDRREAKALLGYPDCSEKWVLFNSLDVNNPIKRFGLAAAAFELAQARLGNLRFRVATSLPHDQVPMFVAACDVILCTSEAEGWPNCVKEALACDVPFVATDVSDLGEIAARESSCRVCVADARVIADSICSVLTGPEPRGLRRHVAQMNIDASSDRLIALYREALARSAALSGRSAVHSRNRVNRTQDDI
jgi:hypothetical protein